MKLGIIQALSGHLSSGQWRLKQENNVYFMAHLLPFNRRGEFRIGSDQVESVTVESQENDVITVRIGFVEDRYCLAQLNAADLPHLQSMVNHNSTPPLAESQQKDWGLAAGIFLIICLVFTLGQHALS